MTLVLLDIRGPLLDSLNDDIKVVRLCDHKIKLIRNRLITRIICFLNLVKKEKPDIIFTTLAGTNLISLLSTYFLSKNGPKIVSEVVTHPIRHSRLIRNLYHRADLLISNSEGIKNYLVDKLSIEEYKVKRIYNGVDLEKIEEMSQVHEFDKKIR